MKQGERSERDLELEWWLIALGVEDRDLYRQLRALAWELVVQESHRSDRPNEPS